MVAKHRPLTTSEQKCAANAKRIFNNKKKDLNLTQVGAANQLGITQPTFSQYINAVIPMNTDFITSFSNLLKVDPREIDANYNMALIHSTPAAIKRVPLLGSISGQRVVGNIDMHFASSADQEQPYYAIIVDVDDYQPFYPADSICIGNPNGFIRAGDQVLFKLKDSKAYRLGHILTLDDEAVGLQDLSNQEKDVYHLDDLSSLHKLAQIKMA